MARRTIPLNQAQFRLNAGIGNGVAMVVEDMDCANAAVQCTVSSGSYQLQGSIDGTNFVDIGAAITADVLIVLTHYWRYLRINTGTVGDLDASLGAHEFIR
jgi:uncharacterized membrane protein